MPLPRISGKERATLNSNLAVNNNNSPSMTRCPDMRLAFAFLAATSAALSPVIIVRPDMLAFAFLAAISSSRDLRLHRVKHPW